MRAIILKDANEFTLEIIDKPACPNGGLLLKVNCVGLCGSDLRKLRSGAHAYPVILGHEVVATVVENDSDHAEYKIGDRIMPCIAATCKTCYYCQHNMDSMCQNVVVQALGYTNNPDYQGGFAEYMTIAPELLERGKMIKIPDTMTDDEAVMIEPYTNIFNSHDPLPFEQNKKLRLSLVLALLEPCTLNCWRKKELSVWWLI